jgi:GNAT superfamily N-acetyltransferase
MPKLTLKLLRHTERRELEKYLRLYQRSFNPDERVSPSVVRSVMVPSAARVNPVHLFAAYRGDCLVGGACTLVLPAFSVVFGSYIFVDPELRGQGLGMQILRQLLRQERRGPQGWNWRLYIEVTVASGRRWPAALAAEGFRFFAARWPLVSYHHPGAMVAGNLGYFQFRKMPPRRFSQPALLLYIHALFYGPDSTHRLLLPRLKNFVALNAVVNESR